MRAIPVIRAFNFTCSETSSLVGLKESLSGTLTPAVSAVGFGHYREGEETMTITWQEIDHSNDNDKVEEFRVTLVNTSPFLRALLLTQLQYLADGERLLNFAEASVRMDAKREEEERRKNDSTT